MESNQTVVLNSDQINQKITRIAHELNENFHSEEEIILVGILNKGFKVAERIFQELTTIADNKLTLSSIKLDKDAPLDSEIVLEIEGHKIEDKLVIVVDDVLNSGNTLIYACKYLLDFKPKRMHTVVLVDRRHRRYPVRADYVGLTLSTTLEDHITVDFERNEAYIS